MQSQQRSKLMRISWQPSVSELEQTIKKLFIPAQIQYRQKSNRSKSLMAAWAIFLNEDITVHHLVKKHSHDRYANKVDANTLTLFSR